MEKSVVTHNISDTTDELMMYRNSVISKEAILDFYYYLRLSFS